MKMHYLDEAEKEAIAHHCPELKDFFQGSKALSKSTRAELEQDRSILISAQRRLLDRAAEADRDLYKKELLAFDALTKVVKNHDAYIALNNHYSTSSGGTTGNSTPQRVWRDAENGSAVAVLSNKESFTPPIGGQDQISLASICRGMVGGRVGPDVRAALSEGSDSAGGYTVSPVLSSKIIDRLRARSCIFQAGALTVPMETERLGIARLETDPMAAWRLEAGAVSEGNPTFGKVEFRARSLAVLVKISRELLEDSVNVEEALMNAFAQSMAVEIDRVAIAGTGVAPEPKGIMNTSGVGVYSVANNGAPVALAHFLTAMQTLDAANADISKVAAIMAPRSRWALAGLTADDGQPLRRPEELATVQFLSTTNVPINLTHGTATTASEILVGNYSDLIVGIRSNIRIQVLDQLFAENLQIGFLADLRADVQVYHPASFVRITGVTG